MKKSLTLFILSLLTFSMLTFANNDFIRFGVIYYYPPFVAKDSTGQSFGFDISIAQALCQQQNKKCLFITMPFEQLFPALDNNKVDAIISALSITDSRKQGYDFTIPYFRSSMSYLTTPAQSNNIDPNTLSGKTVGSLKGTVFHEYLVANYPNSNLVVFETVEEGLDALSKSKIDYLVLDTLTAKWWAQHGANQFKIAGDPQGQTVGQGYGIAVKKGNSSVLNNLNTALQTIFNNGQYQSISNMYFKL